MITRYLTSASLGVTMTFGLLYLMHILIDTGNAVRTYPIKAPKLSWILPQAKDSLPLLDERIEPPPPPPIPPTNKAPTSSASSGSIGVPVVVQLDSTGEVLAFVDQESCKEDEWTGELPELIRIARSGPSGAIDASVLA